MYRVVAGYVTAETEVDGGRAQIDIARGAVLPDDVPAEQLQALIASGAVEPVVDEPVADQSVADEPAKPRRGRPPKNG